MITLSKLKQILSDVENIRFQLPDGNLVPRHFHVTEVGKVAKDFIDCGGKTRKEEYISLQLWEADDYDHRLHPDKLLDILRLSEKTLELSDLPVEVEYQGATIGRYELKYKTNSFFLIPKNTACLARDICVPDIQTESSEHQVCTPGSNCC